MLFFCFHSRFGNEWMRSELGFDRFRLALVLCTISVDGGVHLNVVTASVLFVVAVVLDDH